MRFFRVQQSGIKFDQMIAFDSYHSDGNGNDHPGGLAASMSASGLDGGSRFGGAWDAWFEGGEVVVYDGRLIEEIYDGALTQPVREVARFSCAEWEQMLEEGTAYDYED